MGERPRCKAGAAVPSMSIAALTGESPSRSDLRASRAAAPAATWSGAKAPREQTGAAHVLVCRLPELLLSVAGHPPLPPLLALGHAAHWQRPSRLFRSWLSLLRTGGPPTSTPPALFSSGMLAERKQAASSGRLLGVGLLANSFHASFADAAWQIDALHGAERLRYPHHAIARNPALASQCDGTLAIFSM